MHGHTLDAGPGAHSGARREMTTAAEAEQASDPTLQHPRCVLQILKRHFARYTPEVVSQVCGCAPEELVRVAELLCANSGRERTSAVVYALGWTQHTTGVQMIRTAGILQLLLGNMGRPGGGIMAMRGHSTIQGSTDLATLYDVLPGYLPQPYADENHETLDAYVEHEGMPTGYWANFRKFIVSLLKAWYGDAATPENDFGFAWLPRVDADYSQLPYFDRMAKGEVKGYFLFGQNPAGGAPNARLHRAGLRNLDWLVVLDWFEIESAVFWKDDPGAPAARRHQDRSVLHPGRRRAGEGGQPHQHPAAAPVARQGARPAGRQPLRRLVPLQPRQAPQAALRRLDRPQGPAAAAPHLGLRLRPAAAAARRQPQPDRGRAGPREGAHGDQRLPAGSTERPAGWCRASPS